MNLIHLVGNSKETVTVPIWNGTWEIPNTADNPPRKTVLSTAPVTTQYAMMAAVAAKLQKRNTLAPLT